jgi:hypothetical protein
MDRCICGVVLEVYWACTPQWCQMDFGRHQTQLPQTICTQSSLPTHPQRSASGQPPTTAERFCRIRLKYLTAQHTTRQESLPTKPRAQGTNRKTIPDLQAPGEAYQICRPQPICRSNPKWHALIDLAYIRWIIEGTDL